MSARQTSQATLTAGDVFVKSLNVTLNLAMDYDFVIQTPLMWLDKAETWELADQLGAFDYVREKDLDLLQWGLSEVAAVIVQPVTYVNMVRCLSLTERRGLMFFAPKEIKQETGESLVYNPHRTLVSKEFTFDAAHHLFTMRENANPFMVTPIICRLLSVGFFR